MPLAVYHEFVSFKSDLIFRSIGQLRPTWRFVGGAVLGSVPLLFASQSAIALSWSVGWNTFVVLLAVCDAIFLSRLLNVNAERFFDEQVQVGDILRVEYSFRSNRDIFIEVRDEIPSNFEVVTDIEPTQTGLIAGFSKKHSMLLKPLQRGNSSWAKINIIAQDRIGLLSRRLCFQAEGPPSIRVLPNMKGLDAAYINPRLLLAELGLRTRPQRGDGSEFHRIREAQEGDNLNRLDWRATARAGKNMVRDYRPEQCDDIILCIDHGRLMGSLHGDRFSKLDYAIETALHFALLALSAGDRVGLISFAEQPGPWTKARRGHKHLAELMLATYDLTCSSLDANHTQIMLELAKRQTKRALIVFFTDFVDSGSSQEMFSALQVIQRRHRVLFIGITDPMFQEIANQDVNQSEDIYRGLAGLHLDLSRTKLIDEVRALGIDALDPTPEELTSASVNAYLRIRSRGLV